MNVIADHAQCSWSTASRSSMIERGHGRPLLFLHPGHRLEPTAPVLDHLARGARVIAPTHPGFGRSEQPKSMTTVDDLAYFYLDLLDALDLRDVIVVGVSLGGWIAAEIAVKSTARLSHLVLANAVGIKVGDRETRDIVDIFAITERRAQRARLFRSERRASATTRRMPDADVLVAARNREATARYAWSPYMHDPEAQAPAASHPHSDAVPVGRDRPHPDARTTDAPIAPPIPGARFEPIERAGHFPHLEQPEEFARRVLAFTGKVSASPETAHESLSFHRAALSPGLGRPRTARCASTCPTASSIPKIAADLFHRYYDEWLLADELGLDIMLNEHHQTATCMCVDRDRAACRCWRAQTKRARLLVLGYPIGHRPDPLRAAEELSTIDVISRGRLDMGFVKGVPYEFPRSNQNPVGVMDRFWEAHDFILKAMTTHDGPFNWESEHFHYRQVNIWPRPWQQPHPPVWSTTGSTRNARVLGERGYVMATLGTGYNTRPLYDAYREGYVSKGRPAPAADRFAYLGLVAVARRRGRGAPARRAGRRLSAHRRDRASRRSAIRPAISRSRTMRACCAAQTPPRSFTKDGRVVDMRTGSVQDLIDAGVMFCGTPDQVLRADRRFLRILRRHGQSSDDGAGRLPRRTPTRSTTSRCSPRRCCRG